MELNETQIGILKLRTYMGKIGVPADPRYNRPEGIQALIGLIQAGIIVKIDTCMYPQIGVVDIYLLTQKGEKLVADQEIVATNPGSPEADYA